MAEFVTENAQTRALLTGLTEQNAFAQRLPDSETTFRFHHMMKSCAQRLFRTLPEPKSRRSICTATPPGTSSTGGISTLLSAYRRCGDF